MPSIEERSRLIVSELRVHRKGRERHSEEGEMWIDHLCLFHEDRHHSATFQPDSGVYHCWGPCGTRSLEEVERRLGLGFRVLAGAQPSWPSAPSAPSSRPSPPPVVLPPPPPPSAPVDTALPTYLKLLKQEINYPVTWPDGSLSHIRRRLEFQHPELHPKQELWFHPDGETPGQPQSYWPIYDERVLAPTQGQGYTYCVVEGFKCVDRGNAQALAEGLKLVCLTTGGVQELKRHAHALAQRLQELEPAGVLLWPDNDPPGKEAMQFVKKVLEEYGL